MPGGGDLFRGAQVQGGLLTLYSDEEREAVRFQRHAAEWKSAGFLAPEQAARLNAAADPGLRRTGPAFRAMLFAFMALAAGGAVAFVCWLFEIHDEWSVAGTCLAFSLFYYAAAETRVRWHRLFEHGVEEALAVAAGVLFCVAFSLAVHELLDAGVRRNVLVVLAAAAAAGGLYARWGMRYYALAAFGFLASVPFQLETSEAMVRLGGAVILTGVYGVVEVCELKAKREWRREDMRTFQAWLALGVYAFVNVRLKDLAAGFDGAAPAAGTAGFMPAYYWATFAAVWLVPLAALAEAFKIRSRALLDAGLLMLLATLCTNKPYLGMKRYAWDPAILGILMIGVSVLVTRWLSRGEGGARRGFTAESLKRDEAWETGEAVAAGVLVAPGASAAPRGDFSGGSSGGGGATRGF